MAARVIHFGIDDCYRLSVLRRAGYAIDSCSDLVEFQAALDAEADIIMVDDGDGFLPESVISLARTRSAAPIVLFLRATRADTTSHQVDLVVPTLTPPQEWLLDLANLIIHSRALRASSEMLRRQSGQLRQESAAVREPSRRERARSRHETSRNAHRIHPNTEDHHSEPE